MHGQNEMGEAAAGEAAVNQAGVGFAGGSGVIPVRPELVEHPLAGSPGVVVRVRTLARQQQRDLVKLCSARDPESVAFQLEYAELAVLAAVAEVEGPVRDERGRAVVCRPARQGRLTVALMPRELYDVMADGDVAEVIRLAHRRLTETQEKH